MENLRLKIKEMILQLKSSRRERLGRLGTWGKMCQTLFYNIYNCEDCCSLEKEGRYVCFSVVHEKACVDNREDYCSCQYPVKDPLIKVNFMSEFFKDMIDASHSQILFDGEFNPIDLEELFENFRVSLNHIKLFEFEEAVGDPFCESNHADADDEEFEKEETAEFQLIRDEFECMLLEYIRLAFTDPESLPRCLLDSDEGPTMLLSKLNAWLKSK